MTPREKAAAARRRVEEAKRAANAIDLEEAVAELAAAKEGRGDAPEPAPRRMRPRGPSTLTTGGLQRVSAYFEPSEWERVQDLAADRGISAAALVRQAVVALLDAAEDPESGPDSMG